MKYACIIFDCDGVLVDSEPIAISVLAEMASQLNVEITEEIAFQEFSGRSLHYCFDYIEAKAGIKLRLDFEDEYRSKSFNAFREHLKVIPGVPELIEKITSPYCVASGGPPDKIRLNLTITNLIEKFEGRIFSSYEINSWKPEPEIFLHAAKSMGFAPSECLVVEDSLSGVRAALSGNFNVIGFAPMERNKVALQNEGVHVIGSMKDLNELIF